MLDHCLRIVAMLVADRFRVENTKLEDCSKHNLEYQKEAKNICFGEILFNHNRALVLADGKFIWFYKKNMGDLISIWEI